MKLLFKTIIIFLMFFSVYFFVLALVSGSWEVFTWHPALRMLLGLGTILLFIFVLHSVGRAAEE